MNSGEKLMLVAIALAVVAVGMGFVGVLPAVTAHLPVGAWLPSAFTMLAALFVILDLGLKARNGSLLRWREVFEVALAILFTWTSTLFLMERIASQ